MKHFKSITSKLAFVLVFTVAVAIAADAPKLTFKFTKNNVPGAQQTFAEGINNAGVTVGQYQDTSGVLHGYILNGKMLTKLDVPNGTGTSANGLPYNGAITVVGGYTNHAGASVGFLYKKGKFTDITGPTGAVDALAAWINDKEEIVGWYEDSHVRWHGFRLKGKTYKTLDVPGATTTYAEAINNKGYIVLAWWDSSGVEHSSLYNGKTYKTIDVPFTGARASQANGINNEDDIVYYWADSSGLGHGALLQAGKYYKFDHPKAVETYGDGINDNRTISGGYQAHNGLFSGIKATY
jgi:uncharacterized membrane protein